MARDIRLDEDEDFILSKRHENSLKKLLEEHPFGVSDASICRMLDMTPEELADTYRTILLRCRQKMGT